MEEQQKYGEILLKVIKETKDDKIQTSEQLIQELIHELSNTGNLISK